jgi:hypothetical protein
VVLKASEGIELCKVLAFDADMSTYSQRYVVRKTGAKAKEVLVRVLDDAMWEALNGEVTIEEAIKNPDLAKSVRAGDLQMVFYCPPGVGEWKLNADAKERNHLARRALLLGDTLAGMQVLDLVRLISTLQEASDRDAEITIAASGDLAGVAVYASIFGGRPVTLDLTALPSSHLQGPILINVLRGINMPEAVAIAAETNVLRIKGVKAEDFAYPLAVQKALEWKEGQFFVAP